MKSARKARDQAATANCCLLFLGGNKMDFDIMDAISRVGFPIAAFCAILFLLYKESIAHKEEVNTMKDVLSQINETLSGLKQLIEDKLP